MIQQYNYPIPAMKPFLALSIFLGVVVCHIHLSSAYSDRAALGGRLIRSIKSKRDANKKQQTDTLSEDMKKQMKRIDALEDIFIGSSGSPGSKEKVCYKDSGINSSD